MKAPEKTRGQKVQQVIGILLILSLFLGASRLARANYRRGRADREGAFRLGVIMFALQMLLWLCRTHIVADSAMIYLLVISVSTSMFVAATTWMLYLAIEPWVRRRWPQAIISWSRLLSGEFRDPLVGRDILFGVMLGVVWILIIQIRAIPTMHRGASPNLLNSDYLVGGRQALGAWLQQIPQSIFGTLEFFILLFGLRFVLRKDWLAAIAFVAIFVVQKFSGPYAAVELPAWIAVYAIAVLIVFRFGLIPLAVAIFSVNMLANVPLTADFSAWYMTSTGLAFLSVVALASWGFYHSLGGQVLWKAEME